MIEMLWRCCFGGVTAGFTTVNGVVAECAPVLKWARGKDVDVLRRWVESKSGSCEMVADIADSVQ